MASYGQIRPNKQIRTASGAAPGAAAASAALAALKADMDAMPRPGETEREAKIRAHTAKMRLENQRKAGMLPQEIDEEIPTPVAVGKSQKRKINLSPSDPLKIEEDSRKLDAMIPLVEQKIVAVEDEAEKVVIQAAPLAMEATEDLRSVQASAIRDIERSVKTAVVSVAEARRELDKRQKIIENFVHEIRDNAKDELSKMAARVEAAAEKVEEHKNVRKDHEQAIASEKLFGDLAEKLASVEIDCEKASMMAEPLAKVLNTNPETISNAELRETREALRIAQATLAPTMRLITAKVTTLKGHIKKKMQELHARGESAQALLETAQGTVDEAQSRAQAAPILKETADRIAKVEETLLEMRETESPFLMGIEVMPADESTDVLQRMEAAAATAHSTMADAMKYVSMKMVEVNRFAEGASESARKELEKAKQQLDDGVKRVRAFQEETAKRKRQNLVVMVKEKIDEAETAVLKLKEAGAELPHLEGDAVPDTLHFALSAEVEAQTAVTAARRELQERLQELRPHDNAGADVMKSNSELMKTKVRVNYMEQELAKFRKLARNLEERIKVGKSLTGTSTLLEDAEVEVDKLVESVTTWPEGPAPEDAQSSIRAVQAKLSSAINQVEMKLQNAQGLELKELKGIFSRLQAAQQKLDSVKENARQRARAISGKAVKTATDAIRQAESTVAAVSAEASKTDMTPDKLQELNEQARKAISEISAAQRALSDSQASAMALESKVEFARLQLRVKALDRKGRGAADKIMSRFEALALEAETETFDALRNASRKDEKFDADSLFTTIADGDTTISEEQFSDFLGQAGVASETARVAYARVSPHGLSRQNFAAALASFHKVVRDITLTDGFEINTSKKIRKLEIGEVIEACGTPKEDANLGLSRVECRSVRDGVSGWVTVKSAGGAVYIEKTLKPYLWCTETVPLQAQKEKGGKNLLQFVRGDVVELLEGPVQEKLSSESRVRGVACHEDAVGWLQISTKSGETVADIRKNVFKCSEPIAMTDISDFDRCTMIRKIETGEALELLEDAPFTALGVERRKFRACKDSREGWVTVKGCQGSVFLKEVANHYVVKEATPMHTGLSAECPVVRVLMTGEAFNAFQEPKQVSGGECISTWKVRSIKDGTQGWITSTVRNEVMQWTPKYKVLRSSPLTSTMAANEAAEPVEVVRILEPGETVDVTEQPNEDRSTGQLRVRCIVDSDRSIGWATVREAGGPGALLLMEPIDEGSPNTPPGKRVKEEDDEEMPASKSRKGAKGKGKGKPKK